MPPKHPANSINSIVACTPDSHVRKIVRALLADPTVHAKASILISKLARHAKELKTASAGGNPLKRDLKTMLDVEICIRCNEPYHEDDNNEKSCWHHDCDLEADYDADVWVDWDERCHGDIDTEANRKSYPDGFMWGCCNESGTSKGCKWDEHQLAEDPEDVMEADLERYMAVVNARKRIKVAARGGGGVAAGVAGVAGEKGNGGEGIKKGEVIEISDDE